jgi:glutamate-1-semialdehyde 2,1-aminomutase
MSQSIHPVAQQIEETYRRRTPGSAERHHAAQRSLPGGDSRTITYFHPYPLYIAEGRGQRMFDVDGNEYLDFLGNYTSIIHGHGHPKLAQAIAEQAARGTAFGACTDVQVALAEEICRRMASVSQVRFCNSGTEATMNAIRAARAFTGRSKVLKTEGGYHGSHDLAEISVAPPLDAAGPRDAPRAVPGEPGIPDAVVQDVVIVPFNDADAARAAFAHHGGELAAVIIEPMLGATGTIPAEEGYLPLLRELCDEYGALLIFDEVITLRLDEGGAQTLYGVEPDLTTLGKIIGGGLPVGAFGGRADVMALFAPPEPRMVQSGTYNANPITMAAGLAAMQMLTADEIARINRLGERLTEGLQNAFDEMGVVGQITGIGSLRTVHFTAEPVRDYRSMATSHAGLQRLMHLGLLNRGIFTAKRGMVATSTPMSEADTDTFVSAFADLLGELKPYIADEVPHLLG